MNRPQRSLRRALVLSCIVIGYASLGFGQAKALGQKAIVPLGRYVDLRPQNGFTQLFAVKFLMGIGGSSTLGPLKGALAQDQWEVTRATALSGMFSVSPDAARPYVEAALTDKSHLVQQR